MFIVGVCGGSCSGKTTFATELMHYLTPEKTLILSMDRYYRTPSTKDISSVNFDHPSSFDIDLLIENIRNLKQGKEAEVPNYDFLRSKRTDYSIESPKAVLIVEGILSFYVEQLRNLFDLKVFIDSTSDIRLARRIKRDIHDRGRDIESIVSQYFSSVQKMHNIYIEPMKQVANITLNLTFDMTASVKMIGDYIVKELEYLSVTNQSPNMNNI